MSMKTIRGTTAVGVGATYIPVDRYAANTAIQVTANDTVTFTVDWTGANILFDTAALAAANLQNNHGARVTPASAQWTNLIASGSATTAGTAAFPIAAIRINISAGDTGSVTYTINQGGEGV